MNRLLDTITGRSVKNKRDMKIAVRQSRALPHNFLDYSPANTAMTYHPAMLDEVEIYGQSYPEHIASALRYLISEQTPPHVSIAVPHSDALQSRTRK